MRLGAGVLSARSATNRDSAKRHWIMNTDHLDNWLEANLSPVGRTHFRNVTIPNLPSAQVQRRFTGLDGRSNLMQAFEFWKLMRAHLSPSENTRVLDFGCGWGRIGRFWLFDLQPSQIFCADCLSDAVQVFNSLGNPFPVELCGTRPPPSERGAPSIQSPPIPFSRTLAKSTSIFG